jgi:hypothetical protein
VHKAQGAQFVDLALVDRRLEVEVELLEGFKYGRCASCSRAFK